MVDLALREAGISNRLLERLAATLKQVFRHLLELRARQRLVEVQGPARGGGDERQVDLRLLHLRELNLRLLCSFLQALRGHAVLREVNTVCCLELRNKPVDDLLVPVVTAEVGIAVRALHLEHAVTDLEHAHVEGAASEVKHEHGLFF